MKHLLTLLLACCTGAACAHAAITVRDDAGNSVTLAQPARRIVSLTPHVTELLFAAGGERHIAGAGAYSDYPEAAKRIPRVSDAYEIDIERLLAMRPDLIIVWHNGTPARQLAQLRQLGIPLFHSEPKKLDDIVASVRTFGAMMGTQAVAGPAAQRMQTQLAQLRGKYAGASQVPMFYQILDEKLFTVGGGHILSDAMRTCGARNIFDDIKVAAASVAAEDVLQRNPEAVLSSGEGGDQRGADYWKAYPKLLATRRGNLFRVNGDLFSRPGPRMVEGAAVLCERIAQARQRR
ncbi:MAG TPA: cobalamin-binding protein [Burkholderiaceae bacterium]